MENNENNMVFDGMERFNSDTCWVYSEARGKYVEIFPALYRFGRRRFQNKGLHFSNIDVDEFPQYYFKCNKAWSENKDCLSPLFKEYFIKTFSVYMDRQFPSIDWRNSDYFIAKIMNTFYR